MISTSLGSLLLNFSASFRMFWFFSIFIYLGNCTSNLDFAKYKRWIFDEFLKKFDRKLLIAEHFFLDFIFWKYNKMADQYTNKLSKQRIYS